MNFILTGNGTLTISWNGCTETVNREHPNYDKIKDAIKNDEEHLLDDLISIPKAITNFSTDGGLKVVGDKIHYKGQELHGTIAQRVLQLMTEGLPFEFMARFLDNLSKNPSFQSTQELYDFLDHHALPITEDGCFLAYKRVRDDWRDFHSGKFENYVGNTLEMPRNNVDDDRSRGCSYGFHVGAIEYVKTFNSGGHVIICKVNPADVVSVPSECNQTKLRTCKYEVVGEYTGDLTKAAYKSNGQEFEEFIEFCDYCGHELEVDGYCDFCEDEGYDK